MFDSKDLFSAHAGCIALKSYAPGCTPRSPFLYNHTENLEREKKSMHLPGAQVLGPVEDLRTRLLKTGPI